MVAVQQQSRGGGTGMGWGKGPPPSPPQILQDENRSRKRQSIIDSPPPHISGPSVTSATDIEGKFGQYYI